MKQVSQALAEHLAGEVTTLAYCWKLTRRDGVVLGFTNHDADLFIEGVNYQAASGMSPSAVSANSALQVDELDISGILSSESIQAAQVMDGWYDYAEVTLFLVNYSDLTQGKLVLRTGWLGEITLKGQQFVVEVRGLSQALQQTIGDIYSAGCRAHFADAQCGLSAASHTVTGTITAVNGVYGVSDSTRTQPDGHFTFGVLTFINGPLANVRIEIKEYVNKQFVFALPQRVAASIGNSYSVVAGCDKSIATCISKYNNAVNFRGEPHVPGTDRLLETSATRSTW